ncbi:YraN family protein [Candidatus Peregrinibacteria bacterium HGW-Peregrinibacteria-1]|jgi:putative endonuclease|nr:MAG: YraN family protein [Candidatus Peregrinibacteria bacterium HGW-Peregrinibacteria-1]
MTVGTTGEKIAVDFLRAQNHLIVSTNYRSCYGEIDIISIEQGTPNTAVFTEVKTRSNDTHGSPQSSFSRQKAFRIIKTAQHFIGNNKTKLPFAWRFDLIGIKLNHHGRTQVTQIKNIIDGSF